MGKINFSGGHPFRDWGWHATLPRQWRSVCQSAPAKEPTPSLRSDQTPENQVLFTFGIFELIEITMFIGR